VLDYTPVFDELVARIERDHEFPPGYARAVGHPWRDDLPALRAEFARATDRTAALVALRHLQLSLRDVHCRLGPPADLARRSLFLGVRLWVGGTPTAPDVRVWRVPDPEVGAALAPGDAVVAVDGVPVAAWLAAHPFESRLLEPPRWMADTLAGVADAELPWSSVKEGDVRTLGVVHEGARRDVALRFRAHAPGSASTDALDHPPPMAKVECDADNPVDYGDYKLAAMGVNVCVYAPTKPDRPRIAVVRYPSFRYTSDDDAQSLRMVRVDHDVLVRALRDADGVVLDLHENNGGNNPFIFLGWFSPAPWAHERVITRVVPGLDAATVDEVLWGDAPQVQRYLDAQRAGRATIESRPLCAPAQCDRHLPEASERVTQAPVALVVGPSCASSCDTFALTWATFRLGPIVGRQPVHGYTTHRLPIHVAGPMSQDLGTFKLALSRSEMREGVAIEGEPIPLDWESPRTFENRSTWVRQAFEEAKKRLSKR
jgi:hypothetical protein